MLAIIKALAQNSARREDFLFSMNFDKDGIPLITQKPAREGKLYCAESSRRSKSEIKVVFSQADTPNGFSWTAVSLSNGAKISIQPVEHFFITLSMAANDQFRKESACRSGVFRINSNTVWHNFPEILSLIKAVQNQEWSRIAGGKIEPVIFGQGSSLCRNACTCQDQNL